MAVLPVFIQYPFVQSLKDLKSSMEETDFFHLYLLRLDTNLLELIADSLPCILILSVRDHESRKQAKVLMENFNKILKKFNVPFRHPGVRVLILAEKQGIVFDSWSRFGVQEFIITPIFYKEYIFKLARHYYKAVSYLDAETLGLKPLKETHLNPIQNEVEWRNFVVPTKQTVPEKTVIQKYQVTVETDEIQAEKGKWVLSAEQDDSFEETWEWVADKVEESVKTWKFKGDKPVYSTKKGVWLFKGEKPQLWKQHKNQKLEDLKDKTEIYIDSTDENKGIATKNSEKFSANEVSKQYFSIKKNTKIKEDSKDGSIVIEDEAESSIEKNLIIQNEKEKKSLVRLKQDAEKKVDYKNKIEDEENEKQSSVKLRQDAEKTIKSINKIEKNEIEKKSKIKLKQDSGKEINLQVEEEKTQDQQLSTQKESEKNPLDSLIHFLEDWKPNEWRPTKNTQPTPTTSPHLDKRLLKKK